MTRLEEIRESVSRTYTKAVRGSGGCCVPTCCDGTTTIPKGEAAKVAGYSDAELCSLPTDAVENAFGCGNPLAFIGVREGDVVWVDRGAADPFVPVDLGLPGADDRGRRPRAGGSVVVRSFGGRSVDVVVVAFGHDAPPFLPASPTWLTALTMCW